MPIYEYACRGCGHEFEALVRTGTEPACPSCRSTELERLLSVFATAGAQPERAPMPAMSPCGSCGQPGGPGSCRFDD
jgi:putative FmdB family regulatory protein